MRPKLRNPFVLSTCLFALTTVSTMAILMVSSRVGASGGGGPAPLFDCCDTKNVCTVDGGSVVTGKHYAGRTGTFTKPPNSKCVPPPDSGDCFGVCP